jgi:L-cysteine:1D-myo-inositol 2-amino-2-deoxy-alpha-D-glucopyranoside ligase
VQNVTDIDDPLLERATRDGEDWAAVGSRETELFREDMTALRVLPPSHYVGAVEAMDDIAAYVVGLLESGAAYRVEDDVYFSVASAAHFGRSPATTRHHAGPVGRARRRSAAARQEGPARPAAVAGGPAGGAVLGLPARPGRPGWHVECTAIAQRRLGSPLDVQGGGSDLLFPHHEMSAAHAEVGGAGWPVRPRLRARRDGGLDGEKMSKSRGNLVFVSRLRHAGVDPGALRLALLSAHYRSDREWLAQHAGRGRSRLSAWRAAAERTSGPSGEQLLSGLRAALAHDLDTPAALAWSTPGPPSPARTRSTRRWSSTRSTRCSASLRLG